MLILPRKELWSSNSSSLFPSPFLSSSLVLHSSPSMCLCIRSLQTFVQLSYSISMYFYHQGNENFHFIAFHENLNLQCSFLFSESVEMECSQCISAALFPSILIMTPFAWFFSNIYAVSPSHCLRSISFSCPFSDILSAE